ncbi:Lsr2 family protein [Microbacterium sp.]|uniref:histone-like nucleoid-structuring protein Lsr2 n=1 Tax=Microbacterium sp. TaxID=51671 RepID=UPI0027368BC3|nr:Lsr2 family protein [Microbacterium sp.]MDP3949520.1 Lsr2 family protein [Microbacterium sp.]
MARKIVHQLVDDLDGEVLEAGSGEEVTFSLNGVAYEIDLSEKNAAALREALEPWIAAARRVSAGGNRGGRGARSRGSAQGGPKRDLSEIRTWAKANGHQVSDRGRVPDSVLQAYDAAH